MGMYTEILIKANVRHDAPEVVKDVLRFMFNNGQYEPGTLPDHDFFKLCRWSSIGQCSSHYHIPWADSAYKNDCIFSRSDLKNYEGEIEAFFDWVKPYLDHEKGECIGYSWYEEDIQPTLVLM